MKKLSLRRFAPFAILAVALLFAAVFAAAPAPASGASVNDEAGSPRLQTTPEVPVPTADADIIVPETGPDNDVFISNWLIWVILGIALVVALVALIARAAAPPSTTVHHHDDDDHL